MIRAINRNGVALLLPCHFITYQRIIGTKHENPATSNTPVLIILISRVLSRSLKRAVKIRSALIRVYSAAVRHLGTREGEREGLPATIRDIGLSHCQP